MFPLQAMSFVFFPHANSRLSWFLPTYGTEEPWGEIQGVAEMKREALEAKGMRLLGYWSSPLLLDFCQRRSFVSVSCAQNLHPEIFYLSVSLHFCICADLFFFFF